MTDKESSFESKVASLKIGKVKRHIFLCGGKEQGGCCISTTADKSWSYLKKRIQELFPDGTIHRTKVGCLRVCAKGPIAVIYPEGVWYHSCDEKNLEKILTSHVLRGEIVQELEIKPVCDQK